MYKHHCTLSNPSSLKTFQKTYLIHAVSTAVKHHFKLNQSFKIDKDMTVSEEKANDTIFFNTVPTTCRYILNYTSNVTKKVDK